MKKYNEIKHDIVVYFVKNGKDGKLRSLGKKKFVPLIEFGDTVPCIGDSIVSPFQDDVILDVTHRYFSPKLEPIEIPLYTSESRTDVEMCNMVPVYLVVNERLCTQQEEFFSVAKVHREKWMGDYLRSVHGYDFQDGINVPGSEDKK